MDNGLTHIETKNGTYPIAYTLNVMQSIQKNMVALKNGAT